MKLLLLHGILLETSCVYYRLRFVLVVRDLIAPPPSSFGGAHPTLKLLVSNLGYTSRRCWRRPSRRRWRAGEALHGGAPLAEMGRWLGV
jgi:hypothetical protein